MVVPKGINLSETFKLTKSQCYFSPNGKFIANASQFRLVIREFETLQILAVLTCTDAIDKVSWSPDSKLVLTSYFKRGTSQVWSVQKSTCVSKLDEGSSGLADAIWCPDSRQVLTWAEFGVRINVWSLQQRRVSHIQSPKLKSQGCCFYKKFAVVLERRERQDYISVFNYSNWSLICNFKLTSEDAESIQIVNGSILVCDTRFSSRYLAYSLDGTCLAQTDLYSNKLGIKCVTSSSSQQFAAMGCYDGTCKLLNSVSWSVLREWRHTADRITPATTLYREEASGSRFAVVEDRENLVLPFVKANHDDPYLLVGVGVAEFSASGRYLATRSDSAPSAVWIWDMEDLSLSSLVIHQAPVVGLEWDPVHSKNKDETLAMSCNGDSVYVWSSAGVLALRVPNCETLNGAGELGPIRNIAWSCRGNCLILKGDYHFCLCYFPDYRTE